MYSNILFFTLYGNFTVTLGDLYPNKFISKLVFAIQLIYTVIITLFFVNKIVDVDVEQLTKKNRNLK
jgi:hypothetical protein